MEVDEGQVHSGAEAMPRPIADRLRPLQPEWLVGLAIALAVCIVAFRFVRLAVGTLSFPYPIDYGEGAVLDVAIRLADFENIYPADLTSPPWFVAKYPPVYYMVRSAMLWYAEPALWPGRLLCQGSAVATAVLIGLTLHRLTRDRTASWLAALTFLATPVVALGCQLDRGDALALCLSWLALWSLTAGSDVTLAVVCFVLSGLTRQSGPVAALAAGYLWLWYRSRRRQANGMLAGVALGALGVALVLNQATGGGFLFHVFTATTGHLSIDRYFLDLSAASALGVGVGVHWLRPYRTALALYTLALIASLAWMGAAPWPYASLEARLRHRIYYDRVADIVRATPGPILADEPIAVLRLQLRSVDFHPFAMSGLVDAGTWDPTPFIQRLEEHYYEVLLLREPAAAPRPPPDLWARELAVVLERHYRRTEVIPIDNMAVISVYRPAD